MKIDLRGRTGSRAGKTGPLARLAFALAALALGFQREGRAADAPSSLRVSAPSSPWSFLSKEAKERLADFCAAEGCGEPLEACAAAGVLAECAKAKAAWEAQLWTAAEVRRRPASAPAEDAPRAALAAAAPAAARRSRAAVSVPEPRPADEAACRDAGSCLEKAHRSIRTALEDLAGVLVQRFADALGSLLDRLFPAA